MGLSIIDSKALRRVETDFSQFRMVKGWLHSDSVGDIFSRRMDEGVPKWLLPILPMFIIKLVVNNLALRNPPIFLSKISLEK